MLDRHARAVTSAAAYCLCWLISCPVGAQAPKQTYVNPRLFDGCLYIGGPTTLSAFQSAVLARDLGDTPGPLVILGEAPAAMAERLAKDPSERFWTDGLWQRTWRSVTFYESLGRLSQIERDQLAQQLSQIGRHGCIVLLEPMVRQCDADLGQWLSQHLRECLARQATLCLVRDKSLPEPAEVSGQSSHAHAIAGHLDLLPDMQVQRTGRAREEDDAAPAAEPVQATSPTGSAVKRLAIELPDDAWVRIHDRELVNLNATPVHLHWPATRHYPLVERQTVEPRSVCDLIAAQRSLYEREEAEFPANKTYDHQLTSGSLVIVGGGGASKEIWERFVELAGGPAARIVVLPTANPDPDPMPAEASILRKLGAEVRVLPQTSRSQVEAADMLDTLRWATGVWFGGGRQWRFVDAYWGTPAWSEIQNVVRRGGVIGGSSAGATIQGDLLVRGHPLGNQIMIADGYRRGLGLLPGVAIDQHFRQRNRFADLSQVVERFPTVLGIGIDEGTALVVQAPTRCEVIGAGSVWLSYPGQEPNQRRDYIEHPTGSKFDLRQP